MIAGTAEPVHREPTLIVRKRERGYLHFGERSLFTLEQPCLGAERERERPNGFFTFRQHQRHGERRVLEGSAVARWHRARLIVACRAALVRERSRRVESSAAINRERSVNRAARAVELYSRAGVGHRHHDMFTGPSAGRNRGRSEKPR